MNVEQGARDSLQLAINAMCKARDAQDENGFVKYLNAAFLEVGMAVASQNLVLENLINARIDR